MARGLQDVSPTHSLMLDVCPPSVIKATHPVFNFVTVALTDRSLTKDLVVGICSKCNLGAYGKHNLLTPILALCSRAYIFLGH